MNNFSENTFLTIYIYSLTVVFGICIGSFLNVVIYRVPKGSFLSHKRSFCPSCSTILKFPDLFPIFSYSFLGGRCRYCKNKISIRYPIVELLCGALAAVCFILYGLSFKALLSFAFTIILTGIAFIDSDTMEIPDSLQIALIPLALLAIIIYPEVSIIDRCIGFFSVSLPMLLLTITINGAFGGGDIKLMAICGFTLGWSNTLLAFFISLVGGGIYAVYLLLSGKSKRGAHIPFGPYLCTGVVTALFFGKEIISRYLAFYNI